MKRRGTHLVALQFRTPDILPDIWYPQLRKTTARLENILADYDFRVMNQGVWSNEKSAVILLELDVWALPPIRKLEGPEIFAKKRSDQFLNKYQRKGRIWVEGNCWVAEVPRQFITAERKLRNSLSTPADILKAKGIASYVAESIAQRFVLLDEKRVLALAKKEAGFGLFLEGFVGKMVIV